MNTGIIKSKVEDKGFGFITPDAGDKDVFFHKESLVDVTWEAIEVGDKVSYEMGSSEKGPRAVNVKKVA